MDSVGFYIRHTLLKTSISGFDRQLEILVCYFAPLVASFCFVLDKSLIYNHVRSR